MVLSGPTFQRVVSRAVLLVFFPLLVACLRAQSGEVAGSMPEDYLPELKTILATAMQRSPQLLAAEFERTVQEARILVADAARIPNLRGTSEFASNQTSVTSNSGSSSRANGVFYRFEAGQPIFHWGALKNQSEAARINLRVAEKNFAMVYRDLAVILRKSFLALTVEKAKLRQGREALRLLRQDIVAATDKKERGLISPGALESERLREREVTLELNRGEAEFAANRRRLARIAGVKEISEDSIPNEIPAPTFSPSLAAAMKATLLRDGAKGTLEYEIYDLKVREAMLRYKIEKTRLLPKINAGASFSLENSTNVNGNVVNQEAFQRQAFSISAQWNIFDGFATRGVVREALAVQRLNEKRLAYETEEILQNAQLLERNLQLDAEALEISEIRRGLAVETKKRAAEEVELGNLPKGDVERAQIGILQADAATFTARAAFLGRWSEFVSLAGHDPVLNNVPASHVRPKK